MEKDKARQFQKAQSHNPLERSKVTSFNDLDRLESEAAKARHKAPLRNDGKLVEYLLSSEPRAAAARALSIVGNDDECIRVFEEEYDTAKADSANGRIEVAASVLLLLWHTELGAKHLSFRDATENEKSENFPRGLEIYKLVTLNDDQEEFHNKPVASILGALYAIVETYRKGDPMIYLTSKLETEILEFRRARVVQKERTNPFLAIRHHMISLFLTPVSTVFHPVASLYTISRDFLRSQPSLVEPWFKILILVVITPPILCAAVYLYSIGPLMSIVYYFGLQKEMKEEGGFFLWKFFILRRRMSDVTVVEAFGPTVILYGVSWLFFTYPYLRRR